MVFIREWTLSTMNTNFVRVKERASRHIKRGKASLPVDVSGSKMSLLKLPDVEEREFLLFEDTQFPLNTGLEAKCG